MTDTLANVSKLKPEIRLARAVSAFKAVLTADRKATFDTSIANLQDHPPNATDVARLTGEIDRNVNRKTRRCFGPRFMNVLQAVQRYASMGDIVIGGSQNLVACGVWAAVRLTLTVCNPANEHVKVSDFWPDAISGSFLLGESVALVYASGRNAPRYEDMALLYPRSKRLQDGLCEYFIVVVNLCQHAVQFVQKSIISQMTFSMADSSLLTFEKELQQWSVFIMEEVALLSAQSAEEEAKENSRFRKVMVTFSTFNEHQQKLARRIRLLDACSTHDYQTPWKQARKQARKQGTTTWFAATAEYQRWRE
ncbi:uncharacterized protein CDV56_103634 [Aspergillus thermomutatus]|uniref:Fungal STAND N-terminal Goodbye domain-containing protein n=1 Tax=Aspergillus thermomutatus TaxID=41047 RepID=A0A397GY72_ASPTH|nr:uncharacterized protein CDV56_103634 [Aspergillus thermomutatus]RHZ54013.1 hypothetical protein CDV56_103634 [Aspergillus thermomutatus]